METGHRIFGYLYLQLLSGIEEVWIQEEYEATEGELYLLTNNKTHVHFVFGHLFAVFRRLFVSTHMFTIEVAHTHHIVSAISQMFTKSTMLYLCEIDVLFGCLHLHSPNIDVI